MADAKEQHTLRVLKAWDETRSLRRLVLEAGKLKPLHATPGQYIEAFPGPDLRGFYALANSPDEPEFELLIKRSAGAADAMAALSEGDQVAVKGPGGRGYPIAGHTGRDLLLFAAGSGIAPIRSLMQYIAARREDYGRVFLFYGHRFPSEFAFTNEMVQWEEARIDLIRTATQPDRDPQGGAPSGSAISWSGPTGRVHDVFAEYKPAVENPAVYVCGMKEMAQDVTAAVAQIGVPPDQVFQNF